MTGAPRFRDTSGLAGAIRIALLISIMLGLAFLVANHRERQLLQDIQSGALAGDAQIEAAAAASDALIGRIASLELLVLLALVVMIGRWIYLSAINARALGASDLQISPGWAVGWYFVPFANLVMPFRAMREIWLASHNPPSFRVQGSAPLIGWWWAFWLLNGLIGNAYAQMTLRADSIESYLAANAVGTAATAMRIALDVIVLLMVARLTAVQVAQHRRPQATSIVTTV